MRYLRLWILGLLSAIVALNTDVLRIATTFLLCGTLSFCSFTVDGHLFTANYFSPVQAATPSRMTGQEIAIPPIIREAPIDLQNSLANDFIVSQQTPYSSGHNEVLIISPSTGTEQRFEVSLPGVNGFRLYQADFSRVSIEDFSQVVSEGSNISRAEVQSMLASFTIDFDSDNTVKKVLLADGTYADFSASKAVVHASDGRIIETVSLVGSGLSRDESAMSAKHKNRNIPQRKSQATPECKNRIRNEIFVSSRDAGLKSNLLRNAQYDRTRAIAWVTAFAKRALEDSLIPDSRNQTLQEISCSPPVECNESRKYSGVSEIRTDLFRVPGYNNQQVEIKYEFYDIPDRLELYYEGEAIRSIPTGGGQTSGNGSVPVTLPDRAGFIGIKLIGNTDEGTRWNYTISCSGGAPQTLQEAREVARRLREDYPGWIDSILDRCPSTLGAVRQNANFEEATHIWTSDFHPGAVAEYRSREERTRIFRSPYNPNAPPLRPGQQCTYDVRGGLINVGPGAGTPDAYSPSATYRGQGWVSNNSHTYWDVEPFKAIDEHTTDGWREYQETWTPDVGISETGEPSPPNDGNVQPRWFPPPDRPWGQ